jgi:hypothetical protein
MRCRDEVDERGYMMQRVVDVHVGFVREAPHTALQVGTSSCWLTPGSRPRASPGLPALLPGWRCCRGMAAMLSTSILQCSRRVMLCQLMSGCAPSFPAPFLAGCLCVPFQLLDQALLACLLFQHRQGHSGC